MDKAAFIAGLPKAELHMHIEGSLEPEMMFALARRNRLTLPFASVEALRQAYCFTRLQDFLDIYYQGAAVLLTEEDFHDLALAYFTRAHDDGVVHAEIFFDPQTHTARGVAFATVAEGLLAGMAAAEARFGMTSRLILCFLRHLSEADAFATLQAAEPWLDRIAGVGLDSSELGHPPGKFAGVFAAARARGLKLVAHAGEEGPPEYVREALDVLHVDRLDHGNRSLEDSELTARLAREGMTLTVCPLSNLKLCVVPSLAAHPIATMLRAGLRATLNSDDPAYFGGYVNDNYRAVASLLTVEEIAALARNSFLGSFLPEADIARWTTAVDGYAAAELEVAMHAKSRAIALVDELDSEYRRSVEALRSALRAFLARGIAPDPVVRAAGAFVYPALTLTWAGAAPAPRLPRAFARFSQSGTYRATLTRPDLFRDYLIDQLSLILGDFEVEAEVSRSSQEIPYPYILDGSELVDVEISASEIARHFPSTELAVIGDEVADGLWSTGGARPLTLFDGPRTDFSLARLAHYTGSPVESVQSYILFTNYHRYVDEFVRWGAGQLGEGGYESLICPGAVVITADTPDPVKAAAESPWRRHQMPAYHLTRPGRRGLSLINIGVGPSNAKTITDHLAVLRPEAWLMIGHCGGLRASQTIGDYVLAHAYLRDDKVLDEVLPPEVPIPPLAEVQVALQRAAETVTGESGDELKKRLRTGTIVTTDDRNWELHFTRSALRFNQSRAVAIDMESATIAAQGYRFRTPYGTLLCVSDKPLHGEIKLPGQANAFYERAISQHLQIGIATIDLLRQEGARLHSRKLRSFDEPPFR